MRRIPRGLAVALGAGLLLTACSSGTTEEAETLAETPSESETEAPELTGTLTIWVDETRIDVMAPIAEDFEAETGIAIDLVQKASGDIRTEFVAQVPTGEGPDVVIGAHDWTGEFVTNGVVSTVELGDKAATMAESAVSGFAYDGQQYGVPYALENIALVRNNDLVSETPATFDELVAQNDTTGAEHPVIIQQGENGDAYHLYPLQTSFGAPVFVQSADGSYTAEVGMGEDAGAAFADYLATLGDDGVLDIAIGGDQAKQLFLEGKSPYIITGPWYVTEFVAAGMDVTVLPVPSAGGEPAQPFVGVQGAFISAKTENPLLANEFAVNYLTRPEVQTKLFELGGRVPAVTAAAEGIDDPIIRGFNEAGASGAPMPAIPEMGSVWGFWGSAQVQIISGQTGDPAESWATMVANIEDAIAGS